MNVRELLPLNCEHAPHGGRGGRRGCLFDHPGGRAVGGWGCGGDSEAHCYTLLCISFITQMEIT